MSDKPDGTAFATVDEVSPLQLQALGKVTSRS